jgi:F-type H+-transporting ATPase subunit a
MPQHPTAPNASDAPIRTPIEIAQADTHQENTKTEGTPAGETHATEGHGDHHPEPGEIPAPTLTFANAFVVVALLVAFVLAARRKLERIPTGFQNFAEFIAESLNGFTVGIIGHGGEKHTPLVGTLFLFIALSNFIGLVPGFHSPTSNVTITLALGVIVFFYVQVQGIKNNGVGGHFSHLLGPKIGKYPLMAPLMLPIELLSELFRPFTLAIRLFGNIFGEDVILVVLAGLGASSLLGSLIPFQFPIMLLACLTCFVQAMVFSTLTCIYISLVAHHDEEHGNHGDTHHAHAAGH